MKLINKNGAEDRNRTGTVVTYRRILSPVRLPVPPPRQHWSGRRDSNPRPPPWQGGVLPLNYFRILNILKTLVRVKGVEPPRLAAPDPKSGASANSATPAFYGDPYGIRTRVTAVKGRCLNRLTKGPNTKIGKIIAPKGQSLATSYSHRDKVPTTIGAEKLNFRVRYGNGCDLLARITRL